MATNLLPSNHRRFNQFPGLDHFFTLGRKLPVDLAGGQEIAVVQFDFRQIEHLCTLLLPPPEDLDRKSLKNPRSSRLDVPGASQRAPDVCGGQEAAAAGQSFYRFAQPASARITRRGAMPSNSPISAPLSST